MQYEPMPAASDPVRKPKRTTRTVLIVIAAVLVVCCLGGVGGGFLVYRSYSTAAGPARDVATRYMQNIRLGDYQGAYELLCQRAQDTTTPEQFIRIQSAQPKIATYEISGTSVVSRAGEVSADVTFSVEQQVGAKGELTIHLLKEDGEWRVCP
ncbi:hypothetical protein ACFFWC_03740 [Plantactinospora siamensis]|uniref:DUF4878 domain-containing protein n=1 Tax=Plantactinospora siamensis TaxID=555372 RepID=A0ABV6NQS3_9ACTN